MKRVICPNDGLLARSRRRWCFEICNTLFYNLNETATQVEEIFDGGAIAMINPRNEHLESNKRVGSEGIGCSEPIVLAKKAVQSNSVRTTVNKTTMKACCWINSFLNFVFEKKSLQICKKGLKLTTRRHNTPLKLLYGELYLWKMVCDHF